MKIDNINVTNIVLDGKNVKQIKDLQSGQIIYSLKPSIPDYFYVESVSASSNTLSFFKTENVAPNISIQYSLNGVDWTTLGSTSGKTSSAPLQLTYNTQKVYLRSTVSAWGALSGSVIGVNKITSANNFNIGGNIMSLIYGGSFEGKNSFSTRYSFRELFLDNTKLINASDLRLPATSIQPYSYYAMFRGCSNLLTAPQILPAKTLQSYAYWYMFRDCAKLTTAPELPATTLIADCYSHMFDRCASLTTAPELPAKTLVSGCYSYMFYSCAKLNKITALFNTSPTTTYSNNWVYKVSASGTFTKSKDAIWANVFNSSAIPTGWTVKTK